MAIPFYLPDDEINNLIVAVIFILSQTRLQRTEDNRELQECMEQLRRLLVEELQRRSRSKEHDDQLKQTLLLLRQFLSRFTETSRTPRRSFESCCDDCKISLHEDCATKDCSQVGLKLPDDEKSAIFKEGLEVKEEFVEESFLWRLVPGVRRTFWTAVPLLCMVGWHLFQISYPL